MSPSTYIRRTVVSVLCASIIPSFVFAAPPAQASLDDWCKALSSRLPNVSASSCQRSELTATGAKSVKGFPILARRVSPPAAAGRLPPLRVLLIGGIHGDELTSSSVVFRWLEWMQSPAARRFDWQVVPVVNPDGVLAAKPKRVNANGVDLNRNFPTPNWTQEAPQYWSKRTGKDPRRYPGKTPLSEPESRWVNEEMQRFNPDVIISIHAPFGVLDFDGAVRAPNRFGRLSLSQVGVYPGSLGNYGGNHKDVPVITIELPNAQAMPTDAELTRIWQDMLKWLDGNVALRTRPRKVNVVAAPADLKRQQTSPALPASP